LLDDPDSLAEFDRRLALRFRLPADRVAERVVVEYDPDPTFGETLRVFAGHARRDAVVIPLPTHIAAVVDYAVNGEREDVVLDALDARVRVWEATYGHE
jgi:hypothetical protein